MSYSVASMGTTNSNENQYLDSAWETRTSTTAESESTTVPLPNNPRQTGRVYESYAAATVSDQVSGITDSDPSPADPRHEELSDKIVALEAMIAQLCQQVQFLTNNVLSSSRDNDALEQQHLGKRQDVKLTPRKHKRPQNYSASLHVDEDMNEEAPNTDDRLTAWDDYSAPPNND